VPLLIVMTNTMWFSYLLYANTNVCWTNLSYKYVVSQFILFYWNDFTNCKIKWRSSNSSYNLLQWISLL